MSFASNARAEMARELCMEKCCARAELAAALLASGGISFRFGSDPSYALSITAAEAASLRIGRVQVAPSPASFHAGIRMPSGVENSNM